RRRDDLRHSRDGAPGRRFRLLSRLPGAAGSGPGHGPGGAHRQPAHGPALRLRRPAHPVRVAVARPVGPGTAIATPDRPGARRAGAFVSRLVRTRGSVLGLGVLATVLLLAVSADLVTPYNPTRVVSSILQRPGLHHPMGTDQLGRDVLSRVIHGARVAVLAGGLSVGIAILLGVLMGLAAGYWSGWVDDVLMRVVDALWSFPTLVLALAI